MKALIAFVVLVYASSSFASSAGPAIPSFLTYRSDGIVFAYFNGTRTGVIPSCATFGSGSYFRFAINTATAGGKAQLAGLIAAHASAEAVWVRGAGDCGVFGDTESLLDFNTVS